MPHPTKPLSLIDWLVSILMHSLNHWCIPIKSYVFF
jgi:hypothetical protein